MRQEISGEEIFLGVSVGLNEKNVPSGIIHVSNGINRQSGRILIIRQFFSTCRLPMVVIEAFPIFARMRSPTVCIRVRKNL